MLSPSEYVNLCLLSLYWFLHVLRWSMLSLFLKLDLMVELLLRLYFSIWDMLYYLLSGFGPKSKLNLIRFFS